MLNGLFLIIILILFSAFFSIAEISLAASRKMKLKQMSDDGDINAARVLKIQENPGLFFTVIQIGLNAVVILGGIFGDTVFSPFFNPIFQHLFSIQIADKITFICSFLLVTSLFIVFADLIPKRIGMIAPEAIAVKIINPMRLCLIILKPVVWLFNGLANLIFSLFKIPMERNDDITSDDIHAVVQAGAMAGVLRKQEHELIENVFELESRTVTSSMTARENVIFFDKNDSEEAIKIKIAGYPHSKFLVCDGSIDQIVGYVKSKDLLNSVLAGQKLSLNNCIYINNALMIPDALTLSEALSIFRAADQDYAVILNEYALVMGILTLKDVMTTLMGDLVSQGQEEQIVARDANSWLVEGMTPIDDVMRVLNIESFPQADNYETIGGFMMYILRKIPKRTDHVKYSGYKFEVVDIDNYKIDQLLVTRIENIQDESKL